MGGRGAGVGVLVALACVAWATPVTAESSVTLECVRAQGACTYTRHVDAYYGTVQVFRPGETSPFFVRHSLQLTDHITQDLAARIHADNPDDAGRVAGLIDQWSTFPGSENAWYSGTAGECGTTTASPENLPAEATLASDLDPAQAGAAGSVQDTGSVPRGTRSYAAGVCRIANPEPHVGVPQQLIDVTGVAEVSYFERTSDVVLALPSPSAADIAAAVAGQPAVTG